MMKYWFLVISVFGLGAILRLSPALARDFPINDGGMFYSMTKQLEQNNFALPKAAEYNHLGIAYAYPPLGFITAGLLEQWVKFDLYDIYRLLPPIMAALTLIPFFWLARIILRSKGKAVMATGILAVIPSGYTVMISGGGMTRALGLVLALWTLLIYIKPLTGGKKFLKTNLLAALFLSATFASHLEMSIFAVVGLVVMTLYYKLSWRRLVGVGVIGIILSSWWWGNVIRMNGVQPFLAAMSTNEVFSANFIYMGLLLFTREQVTAFFTVWGVMGLTLMLARKSWLIPVWFLGLFGIMWRGFETPGTVVLALAAGETGWNLVKDIRKTNFWGKYISFGMLAIWGSLYIVFNYVDVIPNKNEWVEQLSAVDRQAMSWIVDNTNKEARILVYTAGKVDDWASDAVAEWLPAMTGRESVLTIQGTEWIRGLPRDRYNSLLAVKECFSEEKCPEILPQVDFEYLYVSNQEIGWPVKSDGKPEVINFPKIHPSLKLVYENSGVKIWKQIIPSER